MYKFIVKDNKYTDFQFVDTNSFNSVILDDITATPKELKLFSNDTFSVTGANTIKIYHSNFRSNNYHAGILDLTITHGNYKNKMIYLCKPDDKRIPFFFIPYSIPYNFDKSVQKLYITFKYEHWNDTIPFGSITQNLGSIDVLNNFYEYVLYSKSLNISIQPFTKDIKARLRESSIQEVIENITKKHNIKTIDKKDEFVFTLDSVNSIDYDDAFSCKNNTITVYITNVAIIMDYLSLWGSFTNRISSIYLPDRKRSMLPNILSECLCSLKQQEYRICYYLTIYFDKENNIYKEDMGICKAFISKNFAYENPSCYETREDYNNMLKIMNCRTAKELTTRLMLHFNHTIAKFLSQHKTGVFKKLSQKNVTINESEFQKCNFDKLPDGIKQHIDILRAQSSSYALYENNEYVSIMHPNMNTYAQASSPIRRLVDILNNITVMKLLNLYPMSKEADVFYMNWTSSEKIEYINTSSRAIRKIQSKCRIYQIHEQHKKNNKNITYKGYIFDKLKKHGDGKFQYMVYLPELNLTSYVTLLDEYENYSEHIFELFVFMNEENDKKKIKLQICYCNRK